MQKVIKTIKRVRVIFGLATLDKPVDEEGKKLNEPYENIPVIFEVDNRTSFKTSGEPFNTLAKRKHLPIQHSIDFKTEAQEIATGAKYYTVVATLNGKALDVNPEDAETLQSFVDWVENYNSYVITSYDEKRGSNMTEDDIDLVDAFLEDEVA